MPDAPAIDAVAVVGIASRVQELLAQPGTFLSFPLSPVAYPKDDLDFLPAGGPTAEQAQAIAEFAELVNRIPAVSSVWSGAASPSHLWDVYGEVLGAELAKSTLTASEEAEYQQAWGYLHIEQPGQLDVPSAAWLAYRAAQQAYLVAQAAYRQAQGTPVEAQAKAALDQAWQSWLQDGHKGPVEAALRTIALLGAKDPAIAWNRYRSQFDPSQPTSFETAPDGSLYAPTVYAPSSAVEVPWLRLAMSQADLQAACRNAPSSLAPLLGGSGPDGSVVSVAFDYLLVNVVRPWFDPAMFASRAWRLDPGEPALSNGATPPSGACPAYVTGVVLARDITVTATRPAGSGPGLGPHLGYLQPTTATALRAGLVARAGTVAKPVTSGPVAHPAIAAEVSHPLAVPEAHLVEMHAASIGALSTTPIRPAPPVRAASLASPQLLRQYDYQPVFLPRPILSPPPPPPPATNTVQVTTGPDVIYFMAFLCELLPECPDPDPSLSWGT